MIDLLQDKGLQDKKKCFDLLLSFCLRKKTLKNYLLGFLKQ